MFSALEDATDNTYSVESFPYTVPKFIRESRRGTTLFRLTPLTPLITL
jgi:hypothetical protein